MHALEKISSYITRGVYTVSAPFHPFGGAVDIIVVQQEDGSYKSSPWYVRFGNCLGVLKAKEKVVNICVNGVEAGFHMYLDHTGEAFFMKEIDSAEEGEFVISSPPSSGDEVDDKMEPMVFQKEVMSCNYDAERKPIVTLENGNGQIVARTTSRRSQILGLMFGRKSVKETVESGEVQRVNSMECAQIAADLLESRWPTGSPMSYKEGTETSKEESVCVCGENLEGTPKHNIVRGVHFEETVTNTYTLETCDVGDSSKVITESVITSEECCLSTKASILNNFIQDAKVLGSCELSDGREVTSLSHVETLESSPPISFDILTETHETLTSEHICEVTSKSELDQASDIEFSKVEDYSISTGQDDVNVDRSGCPGRVETAEDESRFQSLENLDKEQFPFDTDSFSIKDIKQEVSVTNPNCETDDIDEHDSENPNHEDCIERVAEVSVIHGIPLAIPRSKKHLGENEFLHANYGEIDLLAKSLPIIRSQVHDTEGSNLLHPLSCSLHFNSENTEKEISLALKLKKDAVEKQEISEAVDSENMGGYNASPIKSAVDLSVSKELQIEGTGADTSSRVFDAEKENIYEPQGTIAIDHDEKNFSDSESSGPIAPSGGRRSIWPFSIKKSKTISTVRSPPESLTQEDNNGVVAPIRSQSLNDREDIQEPTIRKQVRSLTPTSEELTSLNLNEGGNLITFRFSTAMLGQQQVDARIYLWKWNTRIVISDVDGTITKSDVLGQFMPLVGKDWSQTGVAHLFSAIKENGYQLLFLSARSISQAYLTRQFLLTLKQDGKALPDGPVVISPDGLFRSLYREVIRRAPHEFKIKCLEDIKALFPSESGPFYAGFGNRDTDEISYLKVGVPKGKIFIINPKGEVAVNCRVNTKSYTSLHALVNGMFPPMSTVEQEDFNDLNFWKLPLPDINI